MNVLQSIITTIKILLFIAIFTSIIYLSLYWCKYLEIFNIKNIYITGNHITLKEDILKISKKYISQDIFLIHTDSLQKSLSDLPYVKVASVSKIFPSTILIRIEEREPLSFLKLDRLYVVDEDLTLLPLPKAKIHLNIPIISYNSDKKLKIRLLQMIENKDLVEAIQLIKNAKYNYPSIYKHLSELVIEDKEFKLITIDQGVPIYLGKGNWDYKLKVLSNFQQKAGIKNIYSSFRYIDLRWKKQIIVREKRTRG
ncbi:MAG: FtsQ-type POTRA domain-containing protein [Candidatus Marinimicrobia bacterium]|nr:FtsQ-type POTRA domain-containing protein [Candidatus Neomarinimicrobiota bacterium]